MPVDTRLDLGSYEVRKGQWKRSTNIEAAGTPTPTNWVWLKKGFYKVLDTVLLRTEGKQRADCGYPHIIKYDDCFKDILLCLDIDKIVTHKH